MSRPQRFRSEVVEHPATDDVFVLLPEEVLELTGWGDGTELDAQVSDGRVVLTKREREKAT